MRDHISLLENRSCALLDVEGLRSRGSAFVWEGNFVPVH